MQRREQLITRLLWVLGALIYAFLTFVITYKLAGNSNTDMHGHSIGIIQIWDVEGFAVYFTHMSCPGWHCVVHLFMDLGLTLRQAGGAACACFAFLTAFLVFWVSSSVMETKQRWAPIAAGVVILFMTAIWLPFYNEAIYYGQGSPTIWHSPTYNAVKPFALLSCLVLFRIIQRRDAGLKMCLIYALLTLVCLFLKPSFFQVQAPGVFLFLLIDLIRMRNLRFVLSVAATFIPALAYMVVQLWIMFYTDTGGGEGISFGLFTVYGATNSNLPISILLLLAFPLYSTVVLRRDMFAKGSPYLFLALMICVGFCEYSFVMENGFRMYHGNFSWGYMLSVFLYLAFALPLFLKRFFFDRAMAAPVGVVGCVLIVLHFVSGLIYYGQLVLDATGTMVY